MGLFLFGLDKKTCGFLRKIGEHGASPQLDQKFLETLRAVVLIFRYCLTTPYAIGSHEPPKHKIKYSPTPRKTNGTKDLPHRQRIPVQDLIITRSELFLLWIIPEIAFLERGKSESLIFV